MSYQELFTPFKIGSMRVKNRIVMSPMGTNSALANGRKTAEEIDYFIERARGGAGLIIMGCQPLNEKIAQGSICLLYTSEIMNRCSLFDEDCYSF